VGILLKIGVNSLFKCDDLSLFMQNSACIFCMPTCLDNLERLGDLTAARKFIKVREMLREKILSEKRLFVVNFTFGQQHCLVIIVIITAIITIIIIHMAVPL